MKTLSKAAQQFDLSMDANERWRAVEGHEGLYEVSDLGRLRSLPRVESYDTATGPRSRNRPGKIMSLTKNTCGYRVVGLCMKGAVIQMVIHRVVAKAFLPNPENKAQVNHKDGNKDNNAASNLEWATPQENINHSVTSLGNTNGVPVDQYDKAGNFIASYPSATAAGRALCLTHTGIRKCAIGQLRSYGGFVWRRKPAAGAQTWSRQQRGALAEAMHALRIAATARDYRMLAAIEQMEKAIASLYGEQKQAKTPALTQTFAFA